ncbi:MAG: hypothetical protein JXA60_05680 [Candidatus Coatesbacteria bacterium]|nr:hypothetical protein [Candidatus Coatesbacteria bacterium]
MKYILTFVSIFIYTAISAEAVLTREVKESYPGGIPKTVDFSDGKFIVKRIEYYQSGQKHYEITAENKGETGEITIWNDNLKPSFKGTWEKFGVKWKIEGFHDNHKKSMQGEWTGQYPHGDWRTWFSNGKLEFEGSIYLGKPEGRQVLYYDSGNMRAECNYTNGIENGKLRLYYQDGRVRVERKYDYGKIVYNRRYNKKGVMTMNAEFAPNETVAGRSVKYVWPMEIIEAVTKNVELVKPLIYK